LAATFGLEAGNALGEFGFGLFSDGFAIEH
jgi:hypothetical protein